jgi:hypothetical protein
LIRNGRAMPHPLNPERDCHLCRSDPIASWSWAQVGGAVAGDLFDHRVTPGGVDVHWSGMRLGNGDELVVPACGYPFFFNRHASADRAREAVTLAAGHHGAAYPTALLWNGAQQRGWQVAVVNDGAMRYLRLGGDAKGAELSTHVWWARWLTPGEEQEACTVFHGPVRGHYREALERFRELGAERWGSSAKLKANSYQ